MKHVLGMAGVVATLIGIRWGVVGALFAFFASTAVLSIAWGLLPFFRTSK